MKTETFQNLVLEKFESFEKDITGIKNDISNMKKDISSLKDSYASLESKVDLIFDQTAILTEFKTDTEEKLARILDNQLSISEIVGEHEIAIRTLRRKPV